MILGFKFTRTNIAFFLASAFFFGLFPSSFPWIGEAMAKAKQAESKPEDKKDGADGNVKDAEFTEKK